MLTLLLALACSEPPPPPAAEPPPAPPAQEAPTPAGSIGGEPILPEVVVVGAISAQAVEAGVSAHQQAIDACWAPARQAGLSGKVLLKFTIDAQGALSSMKVKSTSLRHEPTETCLVQAVSQARFEPLQSGRIAIVHYPLVLEPGGEP